MDALSSPPPTPPFLDSGDNEQYERDQQQLQHHLKRVDSSLNALSLGFLAAALLVSAFLVVALLERFLHRRLQPATSFPAAALDTPSAIEVSQPLPFTQNTNALLTDKLCLSGVSVLMPGQDIPTFIARPAPFIPHQAIDGIERADSTGT
ncbi:hypothetical protein GOP47_0002877 [Adiantum capillus-veneris]|uniref:Uncharacterized protein n=1 Tax=Adiantum capillus-veneris TaxID=13818 RepID=A0A9D4VBQ1_ADICA|nr:hypothetical protein GOP47_0002877 [Adiantum capillus-veneris]